MNINFIFLTLFMLVLSSGIKSQGLRTLCSNGSCNGAPNVVVQHHDSDGCVNRNHGTNAYVRAPAGGYQHSDSDNCNNRNHGSNGFVQYQRHYDNDGCSSNNHGNPPIYCTEMREI